MGAASPPTPNGDHWIGGHRSRNGARADQLIPSPLRIVVLGYITAAAMPPVGLIIGVFLALRPARAKHWIWIILISLAASLVWFLIISSGLLSATTNDQSY